MDRIARRLLFALFLTAFLAGCGSPRPAVDTLIPTPSKVIVLPAVAPSPTVLPPSATPPPTLVPTATNAPTQIPPTVVKVDLTLATLRLEELPKGFQPLDEKSQAQAGLAPDSIRQSFSGIFRQAQLIKSFAYATNDPKAFEIVVGLVFSPILPAEQPTFDQMLVDPNGAIKNFAKSFGGEAKALANLSNVGDSRTGWGFTTSMGSPPLKGEMALVRRDTIVALLLTMYPSDQKPAAPVVNLAQTLDTNMKKALGK